MTTRTTVTVHVAEPAEVVRLLRDVAAEIEREGLREFELFDPLRALLGQDTTLVEVARSE